MLGALSTAAGTGYVGSHLRLINMRSATFGKSSCQCAMILALVQPQAAQFCAAHMSVTP
jgi:hypothetical protein